MHIVSPLWLFKLVQDFILFYFWFTVPVKSNFHEQSHLDTNFSSKARLRLKHGIHCFTTSLDKS